MKLRSWLYCIFLLSIAGTTVTRLSAEGTHVPGGDVSGTWLLTGSPYYIDGEIAIPPGNTLTIEPGVDVIFTGHYKFNVQGQLLAVGTREDSILFTAQDAETGWHGLRFTGEYGWDDSSKIVYCKLKYGKAIGEENNGGAILVDGFDKLLISNCLFTHNGASGGEYPGGAAIALFSSSPIIANNIISHNSVVGGCGGGINIYESHPILIENVIFNNRAMAGAGILCNGGSNAILINNTITRNVSENGGGGGLTCGDNSDPIAVNTIIYGNTASWDNQIHTWDAESQPRFYYCDVQGGIGSFPGDHNINADPLFANAANGDFHLQEGSPCIDAGTAFFVLESDTLMNLSGGDYNGNAPDMGALETPHPHPEISVTPADILDFGTVYIGFPDTITVQVQNIRFSVEPLHVTDIQLLGDGFTADTDTFTLLHGESRLIPVVLDPAYAQEYSGTLTISSNDPNSPTVTLTLLGNALEPPDIAVLSDSLSDTLLTGASSVHYLTIENTGDSDLQWEISLGRLGLGAVTFTKEDYADWTLPENQDRITDNVWITRANTQGIFNAATETGYSYYVSPDNTEWAYGLTEELEPEDYQIWRTTVYPPPEMVGQPLSMHLITDDIYFDVMFHSWTSMGDGGGFSYTRLEARPRWLSVSPDSGVTAAGSSQQVGVNFDATGLDAGGHDAVIALNSNDPDEGRILIPVHLDVTGSSDIYTAIDTLDFGQVFVNYADSLELVVENKGTEDLLITSVVADPAEYTVTPALAGIDPDDSQVFLVKFAPVAVSDYPGTLTFTTTDPDEETYIITLLGEGVEPPIVGVSPDSLTADLFTNDTLQQVLTVSNTGASDLVYEIFAQSVSSGEPDAQTPQLAKAVSTGLASGIAGGSLKDLLGDVLQRPTLQQAKANPMRETAATQQTIAGNPVWRLLHTDPDEPYINLDILNAYGATTLDEVLFKTDVYEPLLGVDFILSILVDADQDTSTGWIIDDINMQMGIDYLIQCFDASEGYLLRFVPGSEYAEFEVVDSLTTLIVDQVADEIILGVNAQHFEELVAINCVIVAYSNDLDLVPDEGEGYITFPLSPPWLRLSTAGGVIPAGGQEDVTVTFDTSGLYDGDYYADILISSNDPVTPQLAVHTRLSVAGKPPLAVDQRPDLPRQFALRQNYPNPFNPVSTIRYEVPQASHLSLVVYDLLGREVVRLVDSYIEPGYQQVVWNGRDRLGREVSSGIYIARLHIPPAAGVTPEYTKSTKMLLLK